MCSGLCWLVGYLLIVSCRISIFLGNSLYLIAFSFYCIITFLGYNGMYHCPEKRAFC